MSDRKLLQEINERVIRIEDKFDSLHSRVTIAEIKLEKIEPKLNSYATWDRIKSVVIWFLFASSSSMATYIFLT
mgnify:CR=1 FL=1